MAFKIYLPFSSNILRMRFDNDGSDAAIAIEVDVNGMGVSADDVSLALVSNDPHSIQSEGDHHGVDAQPSASQEMNISYNPNIDSENGNISDAFAAEANAPTASTSTVDVITTPEGNQTHQYRENDELVYVVQTDHEGNVIFEDDVAANQAHQQAALLAGLETPSDTPAAAQQPNHSDEQPHAPQVAESQHDVVSESSHSTSTVDVITTPEGNQTHQYRENDELVYVVQTDPEGNIIYEDDIAANQAQQQADLLAGLETPSNPQAPQIAGDDPTADMGYDGMGLDPISAESNPSGGHDALSEISISFGWDGDGGNNAFGIGFGGFSDGGYSNWDIWNTEQS